MEHFSKCPRCGELDVLRARCSCGYAVDSPGSLRPGPKSDSGDDQPPGAGQPRQSEGGVGTRERLVGVVMLFAGAVLSYLCVYEPLESAARQEAKVALSLKGAIVCPLAVVMGAAYLILGKRATDLFGTREHPSAVAWVCGVLLVLVGVGLYFYIKAALEAKGYQF